MSLPIFYTFRRCPYCMRAHMALRASGLAFQIREVQLRNLPVSLLALSPKATVPVLVDDRAVVIDESWEIMLWALQANDPLQWLGADQQHVLATQGLLESNDHSFKQNLDRYKYADRYPQHSATYYRQAGEDFLRKLEQRLTLQRFLLGDEVSVADIAIFPFIRQFAMVDQEWFAGSDYLRLQAWLSHFLASELFTSVMLKRPIWVETTDQTQ